jgi:hypothetical protein
MFILVAFATGRGEGEETNPSGLREREIGSAFQTKKYVYYIPAGKQSQKQGISTEEVIPIAIPHNKPFSYTSHNLPYTSTLILEPKFASLRR